MNGTHPSRSRHPGDPAKITEIDPEMARNAVPGELLVRLVPDRIAAEADISA